MGEGFKLALPPSCVPDVLENATPYRPYLMMFHYRLSEPNPYASSQVLSRLQTSLLGYETWGVELNSSLMLLMLTNLPRMLMLPALSLVPLARLPPNGC